MKMKSQLTPIITDAALLAAATAEAMIQTVIGDPAEQKAAAFMVSEALYCSMISTAMQQKGKDHRAFLESAMTELTHHIQCILDGQKLPITLNITLVSREK